MKATGFFSDLMAALLERRTDKVNLAGSVPLFELCEQLLTERGEVSGVRLAAEILHRYRDLDEAERRAFFLDLAGRMDIDPAAVQKAAASYAENPSPATLSALNRLSEPRRQELFRRLNQAQGATAELVRMRLDLLRLQADLPELSRIDLDFKHLFLSWFNRGFLVLRRIDWTTPANILEKIIEYEAVHAINDWDDLRRRLLPPDRRCYAFFHPVMPDEPLIFVEVALSKGIPGSIQQVLAQARQPLPVERTDTAVFYSISNCQEGLRGVSFGNSLIKQVVEDLRHDFPNLTSFVTLSPIPGLVRWLKARSEPKAEGGADPIAQRLLRLATAGDMAALAAEGPALRGAAVEYLAEARRADGLPIDPVARFHLGNGASLHDVHAMADTSANGLAQSCGAMVNYLYELKTLERNHEDFVQRRKVAISPSLSRLVRLSTNTQRRNGNGQ